MKLNSVLIIFLVLVIISIGFFFYRRDQYDSTLNYWGNNSQQNGLWLKPGNLNIDNLYVSKSYDGELITLTESNDGFELYYKERAEPYYYQKLNLSKDLQIYLFQDDNGSIFEKKLSDTSNLPIGEYVFSLIIENGTSKIYLKLK